MFFPHPSSLRRLVVFTRFIQRPRCRSQSVMNQISFVTRLRIYSPATPVFQQSRLITWLKIITKQERKIKAVMRASLLTCCVLFLTQRRLHYFVNKALIERCLSVRLFCCLGKIESLSPICGAL